MKVKAQFTKIKDVCFTTQTQPPRSGFMPIQDGKLIAGDRAPSAGATRDVPAIEDLAIAGATSAVKAADPHAVGDIAIEDLDIRSPDGGRSPCVTPRAASPRRMPADCDEFTALICSQLAGVNPADL